MKTHSSEDISALWALVDKGKAGKNIGDTMGIPKIDRIIGGIQPSRYYLISAASSVGKTAYVLYMMYSMLKNESEEKPTYFQYHSLEIGADVLLAKLMSLYCAENFGVYLNIGDILSFETILSDTNYAYLQKAREWLESVSKYIIILDKGLTARVLYKETLSLCNSLGRIETREDGKEVFIPANPQQKIIGIIDHMILVRSEEGRTKKQEIDLMSSYMVTIKRKYGVSWWALIQQNRESSSMDRRKADLSEPGLNDIKESGTPAEDADIVMQMFYPFREKLTTYRGYKILGDDGLKQVHRSIVISKNRYGIANQVVNLWFFGSVGYFGELPDPEEIDYEHYRYEAQCIPRKGAVAPKKDTTPSRPKEPITFSF